MSIIKPIDIVKQIENVVVEVQSGYHKSKYIDRIK